MKITLSQGQFIDMFEKYGRNDQFSYNAKKVLFNYFEEIDENMEVDIIAICCEYTEYDCIQDFQDDYGIEYENIDDVEYETTVIKIDDESFIIQNF